MSPAPGESEAGRLKLLPFPWVFVTRRTAWRLLGYIRVLQDAVTAQQGEILRLRSRLNEAGLRDPVPAFGPAWAQDADCCGNPEGCSNTGSQCVLRNHPWKRRHAQPGEGNPGEKR